MSELITIKWKTVEQQLYKLPDGFKELALEAMRDQLNDDSLAFRLNLVAKTLSDALCMAFRWMHTPEGFEFWEALCLDIQNNIINQL